MYRTYYLVHISSFPTYLCNRWILSFPNISITSIIYHMSFIKAAFLHKSLIFCQIEDFYFDFVISAFDLLGSWHCSPVRLSRHPRPQLCAGGCPRRRRHCLHQARSSGNKSLIGKFRLQNRRFYHIFCLNTF